MRTSPVSTERCDDVIVVHLDDGKANALSFDMVWALRDAVATAEADRSVVAVVLHGRERRFCAGFDLGVMRGTDFAAIMSLIADGGDLVHQLYGSSVPVVAACNGHAVAGGALLLLGCDLRIGADIDCRIGLNEVAIGLVLSGWPLIIARDRLVPSHLQRAVANAVLTDAHGARAAGFLDEVVAAPDLLDTAVARAHDLGALDRFAYAATVRALRGDVLDAMRRQIDTDRALGQASTA